MLFSKDSDEPSRGFIHMRTPKNRMELRADFNNYDDLTFVTRVIKENARIQFPERYREVSSAVFLLWCRRAAPRLTGS